MTDPADRATPKKAPERRKTLARYGRRGDQVRAVEDKTADKVIVYYKDLDGLPHKRTFERTAEGRAVAKAWAGSYHAERAAEATRRAAPAPIAAPRTTHRALWEAYTASPAYTELRDATRESYRQLWEKWEAFRKRDALVDETTLHHVDLFRTAMQALKRASNQARQVIGVARIVMNWGQSRKLVATNELALFKWKTPKGQEALEPDEYTPEEYAKILAELSPQDGGRWRGHVAWMLVGHHGQRARALRLLTAEDAYRALATGELVWRAELMKAGKEHRQPLTPDGRAALHTALYWRERVGYTGPWLLYAGGGNKRLGLAPVGTRPDRGTQRRARTPAQDVPVTYQGLWRALTAAEDRAGVDHKARRAWHGGRKMNGGNIADATGDARLAMEWLGDTSPAMQKKYLKRRDTRLQKAAEHATTTAPAAVAKRPARDRTSTTAPGRRTKSSPNRPAATAGAETANAPVEAGALTAEQSITYEASNE